MRGPWLNSENSLLVRLGWDECRHCLPRGPVAQWIRHRPTEPGIVGSSPTRIILVFQSVTVEKRHVPQCRNKKNCVLLQRSVLPRCACPSENTFGGPLWRLSRCQLCLNNAALPNTSWRLDLHISWLLGLVA